MRDQTEGAERAHLQSLGNVREVSEQISALVLLSVFEIVHEMSRHDDLLLHHVCMPPHVTL
jgi:hypothetical protein